MVTRLLCCSCMLAVAATAQRFHEALRSLNMTKLAVRGSGVDARYLHGVHARVATSSARSGSAEAGPAPDLGDLDDAIVRVAGGDMAQFGMTVAERHVVVLEVFSHEHQDAVGRVFARCVDGVKRLFATSSHVDIIPLATSCLLFPHTLPEISSVGWKWEQGVPELKTGLESDHA